MDVLAACHKMQGAKDTCVRGFWACRPKTLVASLIPVVVGTALASRLQGSIHWMLAAVTCLMAICIQIGINLANDALDFRSGVDTVERLGPLRATQQGWFTFQQVYMGSWFAFSLAFLFALFLTAYSGPAVLIIALICIVGGYLYSGGPYPISHLGLSDPCVLFFFGIVATATTVYVQLLSWTVSAYIAGLQVGFLATVISAINNMRDVEQDRLASKRTLPVRFGICWARREIALLLCLPFLLGIYWWQYGLLWAAFLPFAVLPLAASLVLAIYRTPPSRAYNDFLARSALLLLLFGFLLSGGFVIQ